MVTLTKEELADKTWDADKVEQAGHTQEDNPSRFGSYIKITKGFAINVYFFGFDIENPERGLIIEWVA